MQCQEIHSLIKNGSLPDTDEVYAHLEECPACQELADEEGMLAHTLDYLDEPLPPLSDSAFGELQEAIAAEDQGIRSWRSLSTWKKQLWVWGVLLVLFVLVWWLRPRFDLSAYPFGRMLAILGVFLVLSGVGLWFSLRPSYKPPLQKFPRWVLWSIFFMTPLLIAILPQAHTGHPRSMGGTGPDFWPALLKCVGFGSMLSFPVIGLIWALHAFERPRANTVLTVGLTCGLFANAVLQIHCSLVHPTHLFWGHGITGMILFLAWAGALKLYTRYTSKQ